MKTPDEIKKGLVEPELFCEHCGQYGEPHGCNRPCGACGAYENAVDAAEYIQQLEAQVPRWISIRDALPGLHEKVLFTPMCNEGAIYIGELNAVGEYGAAYFAVRCGKRKTCYSATHWMPLPEPPEEDA